jgi:hypothetical protein
MALLPNTNAMINISPMEFDLDDLKEKFKLLGIIICNSLSPLIYFIWMNSNLMQR